MRIVSLLLIFATAVMTLPGLGNRDIWPPDEARYAQVAHEMDERSEWAVPTLNDQTYHDKPPLFFWTAKAAAFMTNGEIDEWSSRFPSALGAVLAVAAVAAAAGLASGAQAGLLSGLLLLSTALFMWQSRYAQLDMLFGGLLATGMLSIYGAVERGGRMRLLSGFFFLGLAVLAKGPLALLALLVIGLWTLFSRPQRPEGTRLGWATFFGFILMFAVIGAWVGAVYHLRGIDYLKQIIGYHTLERIQRPLAHQQPWPFYFKRAPSNFAPWIPLALLWIVPSVWKEAGREGRRLAAFALLWIVVFFGLQTALPGKRSIYLLTILPAWGLFIGIPAAAALRSKVEVIRTQKEVIRKTSGGFARFILYVVVGIAAFACAAAGALLLGGGWSSHNLESCLDAVAVRAENRHIDVRELWDRSGLPWPEAGVDLSEFLRHLRLVGLCLAFGGAFSFWSLLKRRLASGIEFTCLTIALGFGCAAAVLLPHMDETVSRRALADAVRAKVGDAPTAIFRHLDEGVLFYFGRTTPELAPTEEETIKIAAEPEAQRAGAELEYSVGKLAAFFAAGSGDRYCLIRADDFADLAGRLEGEVVLTHAAGSSKSFVLVKNGRLPGVALPSLPEPKKESTPTPEVPPIKSDARPAPEKTDAEAESKPADVESAESRPAESQPGSGEAK